ncbi:MAG: site-2 protease family protein [Planctomycetes bacterium]|nr:site-2 protease family protein [Planctomycetota bacterium]
MNLDLALLLLPGLIIGLTVHEAAHAISAKWLGDRTAEKMGRVSLNPLRHLSIYGTLALFFLGFGWGKPVIVNLYNFKKPKFYYLLSSLAGPLSNLILCGISLGIMYMHPPIKVYNFLIGVFLINGMLAAINLVPIPPLDGSKIWPCLIPGMKPTISGKWSMIWIVVLIVGLKTGGISKVLGPIQDGMWSLLPEYKAKTPSASILSRPKGFPEVLVLPNAGKNVSYYNVRPNNYRMIFTVEETPDEFACYPAIEKRLMDYNWKKLSYKLEGTGIENNGQWEKDEIVIDGEAAIAQYYHEYWIKSSGDLIWLACNYTAFPEKGAEDFFIVSFEYQKSPTEYKEEIARYKELHPEEFEGIEVAE